MRRTLERTLEGLLAGVAGTAAMTLAQQAASKLRSRDDEDGDSPEPSDPWARAPTPAQVAKRLGEDVLHVDVPPDRIPLLTRVMHWSYGIGWGGVYGLTRRRRPDIRRGAAFGLIVWATSYAQLVPLGIYEPPWRYPASEVAMDVAYHLAYGVGTASAAAIISHRS
jgi:hypothetical protein